MRLAATAGAVSTAIRLPTNQWTSRAGVHLTSAQPATETVSMANSTLSEATTDEELAQLISRQSSPGGNQQAAADAFVQLYRRYQSSVRSFVCARVNPNDLDDLEQEIWRKIWRYLPTKFQGGNFRAWMYQIARNYIIDHSRRQKRVVAPGAEADEQADPRLASSEEPLLAAERAEALRSCLERMQQANAQSADLVRQRLAGKGYAEICTALGIDRDRAYQMFERVKGQLKTCIQQALAS